MGAQIHVLVSTIEPQTKFCAQGITNNAMHFIKQKARSSLARPSDRNARLHPILQDFLESRLAESGLVQRTCQDAHSRNEASLRIQNRHRNCGKTRDDAPIGSRKTLFPSVFNLFGEFGIVDDNSLRSFSGNAFGCLLFRAICEKQSASRGTLQ